MKQFFKVFSIAVAISAVPFQLFAGSAVSDINGKIDVMGGNIDGDAAKVVIGSVSTPSYFHDNIGFQFDGLYGSVQPSREAKGFAVHGFWRDSDVGLLGLSAAWLELGQIETARLGVEGEYYMSRWTFDAIGGVQEADLGLDTLYGGLGVRYYAFDDLVLETSASLTDYNSRFNANIEYQMPHSFVSLYAGAGFGDNSYTQVTGGLRVYLAREKKSLIRRHREDDPKPRLLEHFNEGTRCATPQVNRTQQVRVAPTQNQCSGSAIPSA